MREVTPRPTGSQVVAEVGTTAHKQGQVLLQILPVTVDGPAGGAAR